MSWNQITQVWAAMTQRLGRESPIDRNPDAAQPSQTPTPPAIGIGIRPKAIPKTVATTTIATAHRLSGT